MAGQPRPDHADVSATDSSDPGAARARQAWASQGTTSRDRECLELLGLPIDASADPGTAGTHQHAPPRPVRAPQRVSVGAAAPPPQRAEGAAVQGAARRRAPARGHGGADDRRADVLDAGADDLSDARADARAHGASNVRAHVLHVGSNPRAGVLRRAAIRRHRRRGRHELLSRPLALGGVHDGRLVHGGPFRRRRRGPAVPRLLAGGDGRGKLRRGPRGVRHVRGDAKIQISRRIPVDWLAGFHTGVRNVTISTAPRAWCGRRSATRCAPSG